MIVLVLAGGGGTRLWPLSRKDIPKQFHSFNRSLSLLQRTVLRFINCSDVKKIVVSTNDIYIDLVKKQIAEIDLTHFCETIVEPESKNTAPAIAFAVRYLQEHFKIKGEETLLAIPSDHLIEEDVLFLEYLNKLKKTASKGRMITFGIRPEKPETGYGYIEIANQFDQLTYEIKKFIEKPDLEHANRYSQSPQFYWNSGIFLFSIETFWEQVKLHAPDIYQVAQNGLEDIRANYSMFPNISLDYAIMEKCQNALVCPMSITWSDIGSWDSVYNVLEKDLNKNVNIGNVMMVDTCNCLIMSDKKLISTIGVENLLIIEVDDVLLICQKEKSQDVKNLVRNLLDKGISEATRYSDSYYSKFRNTV